MRHREAGGPLSANVVGAAAGPLPVARGGAAGAFGTVLPTVPQRPRTEILAGCSWGLGWGGNRLGEVLRLEAESEAEGERRLRLSGGEAAGLRRVRGSGGEGDGEGLEEAAGLAFR